MRVLIHRFQIAKKLDPVPLAEMKGYCWRYFAVGELGNFLGQENRQVYDQLAELIRRGLLVRVCAPGAVDYPYPHEACTEFVTARKSLQEIIVTMPADKAIAVAARACALNKVEMTLPDIRACELTYEVEITDRDRAWAEAWYKSVINLTPPTGRPALVERVEHTIWKAQQAPYAPDAGFPAVIVVGLATPVTTIRDALTAAGLGSLDLAMRGVLAVPLYAFDTVTRSRVAPELPVL
ncbi:MAG: hypothetical protein IAE87_11325 [Rhodobacteraceae bacterium]|jgi:hypothetical protein|nr:hypothetical protein [Paracoccaceae bacterium]